jgi:hypothetical protein
VNHDGPATVTECLLDLFRPAAAQAQRVGVRILRKAPPYFGPARTNNRHNITATEVSQHFNNANRQQAVSSAQGMGCTSVYTNFASDLQHTSQPLLARRRGRAFRTKHRATAISGQGV